MLYSSGRETDTETGTETGTFNTVVILLGLILLFVLIMLLAVWVLLRKVRRYPPQYVSPVGDMTLQEWNNWMNSYQSAAQGRYREPETELIPHFQSQKETILNLLAFLGVVSLPYSEIEADKMDTHFTFLQGLSF